MYLQVYAADGLVFYVECILPIFCYGAEIIGSSMSYFQSNTWVERGVNLGAPNNREVWRDVYLNLNV